MNSPAEFADLLCSFGVDVTDPLRRLVKARSLAEGGFALGDVRLVFAHVEATSKAQARPGLVAGLVLDPERLQAAIVAARAFATDAARREQVRQEVGDDTPAARPYEPRPDPSDDHNRWARTRNAAMAWGRVVGDRAPREAVAREMGITLSELSELLEHARVVRPAQAVAGGGRMDPNEDARRKQFREQMHAARSRDAAGAPK